MTTVRAPGKVFLFGEYAVLFGGTAVVLAVDRHAVARTTGRSAAPEPRLVAAAREAALALAPGLGLAAAPDVGVSVDSGGLNAADGTKLGLGSSAAALTAALGAMLAAAGADLADPAVRSAILPAAVRAHDRFQEEPGSGGDVAAAVAGGSLSVRRDGTADPEIHPWSLPPGLALVFTHTGQPARTGPMVGAVRSATERSAGAREAVEDLARQSMVFTDSVLTPGAVIRAAAGYADGLDRLGRASDVQIVTAAHRRIAELAGVHGGSAKPSGAGGGDLAVAFLPDEDHASEMVRSLRAEGFQPVALGREPRGLSAFHPGEAQ